jgi:hypothetical protein
MKLPSRYLLIAEKPASKTRGASRERSAAASSTALRRGTELEFHENPQLV